MQTISPNYVRIFDTTLRDGEQSPGATLTSAEKLEIARGLVRMGVDVIEAGFPAASPDDLEAVRRIAAEIGNPLPDESEYASQVPVICGLARAIKSDIDAAWKAVQHAQRPCIHTFLATSPIHMRYKLRMDPEEVVEKVREMVTSGKTPEGDLGKLAVFTGVHKYPARVKCAILPWHAAMSAVNGEDEVVSTE